MFSKQKEEVVEGQVVVYSNDAPLTMEEAKQIDDEIVSSVGNLRGLLVDMYQRHGWHALGFTSWEEYLQDLAPRANIGTKYLRRIQGTALLEAGTDHELGTFKEGTLRPIIDTLSDQKGFTVEDRAAALELAIELAGGEDDVTGKVTQTAAWYMAVEKMTPLAGSRLVERMKHGEVSANVASELCQIMRGSKADGAEQIIAELSDAQLARVILNVKSTNGEAWKEIRETATLSGTIPSSSGQVALSDASAKDLVGFLNEPNRQKRQEKASEKSELMLNIAKAAARLMIHYYGVCEDCLPDALSTDTKLFDREVELYRLLQQADMIRGDLK